MSTRTPISHGRFLPGAMIGDRWRVVAPLGKGGMGEVYRADDLKLGEAVALKFLPERLERDPVLRDKFLAEARLARQVAHPNVCRVYDIADVGGRPFLTMEYVDGEDLSSLLTRIGRLPHDKAVLVAREICAGLAAAHEKGILHRDLKPSNVMIDGRGRARLTDFGLAALVEGAGEEDPLAGTPAYMAPEQLNGLPPSVASDVYALGLVLYELFTGQQAFGAQSWAEQAYLKTNSTPSHPSQLVPGIEPATERAILRCLETDPARRPADAHAVAAALPGGDPLAAALAAGETPSPELVAVGAGDTVLSVRAVWSWMLGALAALAVLVAIGPSRQLLVRAPLSKPPAVLVDRARDLCSRLGYGPFRDEYQHLVYNAEVARHLARQAHLRDIAQADPATLANAFTFHYMASPGMLSPVDPTRWFPSLIDPLPSVPGQVDLYMSGEEDLRAFAAVPPALDSAWARPTASVRADSSAARVDAIWTPILATLGIPADSLELRATQLVPNRYADARIAFEGHAPSLPGMTMHVELASHRGRLVQFSAAPLEAYRELATAVARRAGAAISGPNTVLVWITMLFFVFLAVLSHRHVRRGQADLEGAFRLSVFTVLVSAVAILLTAHLAAGAATMPLLYQILLRNAPVIALWTFVMYLGFEPILRRTWPHLMVSWMRLMQGRFLDAQVGAELLAGAAVGILTVLGLYAVQALWARLLGQALLPGVLDVPGDQTDTLMGTPAALAQVCAAVRLAVSGSLVFAGALAMATEAGRQRWIALGIATLAVSVRLIPSSTNIEGFDLVALLLEGTVFTMLAVRMGLVSGLAYIFVVHLLRAFPLEHPGASWYWPITAVGLVAIAAPLVWGARAALGNRPWFQSDEPVASAPTRTPPPASIGAAHP